MVNLTPAIRRALVQADSSRDGVASRVELDAELIRLQNRINNLKQVGADVQSLQATLTDVESVVKQLETEGASSIDYLHPELRRRLDALGDDVAKKKLKQDAIAEIISRDDNFDGIHQTREHRFYDPVEQMLDKPADQRTLAERVGDLKQKGALKVADTATLSLRDIQRARDAVDAEFKVAKTDSEKGKLAVFKLTLESVEYDLAKCGSDHFTLVKPAEPSSASFQLIWGNASADGDAELRQAWRRIADGSHRKEAYFSSKYVDFLPAREVPKPTTKEQAATTAAEILDFRNSVSASATLYAIEALNTRMTRAQIRLPDATSDALLAKAKQNHALLAYESLDTYREGDSTHSLIDARRHAAAAGIDLENELAPLIQAYVAKRLQELEAQPPGPNPWLLSEVARIAELNAPGVEAKRLFALYVRFDGGKADAGMPSTIKQYLEYLENKRSS